MKKILCCPFVLTRKLYDWTVGWADRKSSDYALFAIAFMESSFFPIPPDVLLIALVASQPQKWLKKALVCALGSVCGAFLGYAIGYLFYETAGLFIVNFYDLREAVKIVGEKYEQNAFLTIFAGAFTPIPYKAMTISAGIFKISPLTLLIASVIGRGIRFFAVAAALTLFGGKIKNVIEKYFNILSIIFFVLLVGGFIAFKHLLK